MNPNTTSTIVRIALIIFAGVAAVHGALLLAGFALLLAVGID